MQRVSRWRGGPGYKIASMAKRRKRKEEKAKYAK